MANLSIRIDDELKKQTNEVLKELNISQTRVIQSLFEYIVQNKKLPINYVSDEDFELLETVKYRLENPSKKIKVSLDEL